jgi:hypothetical protein
MFAGQACRVGGCVSLTVTVKLQELILPLPSVDVQTTVVTPFTNALPLAGRHTTTGTGAQLSVDEGMA